MGNHWCGFFFLREVFFAHSCQYFGENVRYDGLFVFGGQLLTPNGVCWVGHNHFVSFLEQRIAYTSSRSKLMRGRMGYWSLYWMCHGMGRMRRDEMRRVRLEHMDKKERILEESK
jgi:hypothetical protein